MKSTLAAVVTLPAALAAIPAHAVVSLHGLAPHAGSVFTFGTVGVAVFSVGLCAVVGALAYRFLKAR